MDKCRPVLGNLITDTGRMMYCVQNRYTGARISSFSSNLAVIKCTLKEINRLIEKERDARLYYPILKVPAVHDLIDVLEDMSRE